MLLWISALAMLAAALTVLYVLFAPGKSTALRAPDHLTASLLVQSPGGAVAAILPGGLELPAEAHEVMLSPGDRTGFLEFRCGWGEKGMALEELELLSTVRVTDVSPSPEGTPRVEVVFQVDRRGRLNILASDLVTRRGLPVSPASLHTPMSRPPVEED